MKKVIDTTIIGSGIYGLQIARLLNKKFPEMKIAIIESKNNFLHNNSNNNSGVLHSGIYYPPNSIKAEFCKKGQKELSEFCEENNLPLNKCGKIIASTLEEEHKIISLYENGLKNNVDLKIIDLKEAQQFDPYIKTNSNKLIYIPSTAIGSPKLVNAFIFNQLSKIQNIQINFNSEVKERIKSNQETFKLRVNSDIYESKYVFNCSGPSSDKIAMMFGHSKNFRNIPLKAIYNKIKVNKNEMPKILVYPIPGHFSLGLHLTMEDENTLKFGPSVDSPFFKLKEKENFHQYLGENLSLIKIFLSSFNPVYFNQLKLELTNNNLNNGFKRLSQVYSRYNAENLKYAEKKILIRTPAINLKKGIFESDFIIEESLNNIHLLNFQSPAWTCFLPLSKYLVERFVSNMK